MKNMLDAEMKIGAMYMIIYQNRRNVFSKRTIRVVASREEEIIAYCYMRQAVRLFRKNCILALEKVEGKKDEYL